MARLSGKSRARRLGDPGNSADQDHVDVSKRSNSSSTRGAYYIQATDILVNPYGVNPGPFIVYGLAKKDNRVRYVGASPDVCRRLREHRKEIGDSIQMIVLESCESKAAMTKQEIVWIKKLQRSGLWNRKHVDSKHHWVETYPRKTTIRIPVTAEELEILRHKAEMAGHLTIRPWIKEICLGYNSRQKTLMIKSTLVDNSKQLG